MTFGLILVSSATSEDYKLLETMNNMTKDKYVDMTNTAHGLVEYMTLLQQKCKCHDLARSCELKSPY